MKHIRRAGTARAPSALVPLIEKDSAMHRITSAQTVSSAAASVILFSATLFAGYALAAEGNAASTPVPAGIDTARAADTTAKADAARDEQHIKSLHDRLNITLAQEALWSKVADTMRSNDKAMDALAKTRHDNAPKMTAIDDLRSYGDVTEAHATGVRAFAKVFGSLYDSMTVTQKANADNVFRTDGQKSHKKAA
jgi:hypothetical protein